MKFLLTTTFQSFRRGWFTVLLLLSGVPFFPCFFNPLALRALPLSHLRWAEGEGKSVTLNGLFVLWAFSYISLRHIGGEGWYLDTFSLLRIFFNPSVTMCHLPLYFALQNAGEECRNLSITWFYCFLFSVCVTSLYTLRCNHRKAGHGKGGMCECLTMPWSVGRG